MRPQTPKVWLMTGSNVMNIAASMVYGHGIQLGLGQLSQLLFQLGMRLEHGPMQLCFHLLVGGRWQLGCCRLDIGSIAPGSCTGKTKRNVSMAFVFRIFANFCLSKFALERTLTLAQCIRASLFYIWKAVPTVQAGQRMGQASVFFSLNIYIYIINKILISNSIIKIMLQKQIVFQIMANIYLTNIKYINRNRNKK